MNQTADQKDSGPEINRFSCRNRIALVGTGKDYESDQGKREDIGHGSSHEAHHNALEESADDAAQIKQTQEKKRRNKNRADDNDIIDDFLLLAHLLEILFGRVRRAALLVEGNVHIYRVLLGIVDGFLVKL